MPRAARALSINGINEMLSHPAPGFVCDVEPYGFEKTTTLVQISHKLAKPAHAADLKVAQKLTSGVDPELMSFLSLHNGAWFFTGPGSNDGIFAIDPISEWQAATDSIHEWFQHCSNAARPEWVNRCIAFGGEPGSADRLVLVTSGSLAGKVLLFEHERLGYAHKWNGFHGLMRDFTGNPFKFLFHKLSEGGRFKDFRFSRECFPREYHTDIRKLGRPELRLQPEHQTYSFALPDGWCVQELGHGFVVAGRASPRFDWRILLWRSSVVTWRSAGEELDALVKALKRLWGPQPKLRSKPAKQFELGPLRGTAVGPVELVRDQSKPVQSRVCGIPFVIPHEENGIHGVLLARSIKAMANPPADVLVVADSISWNTAESPSQGETLDMLAELVCEERDDMVEKCLAAGANPDVRDDRGVPALVRALEMNNVRLVRALLAAGADPNLATPSKTGLSYCVSEGRWDLVKLLLDRGADPNKPSRPCSIMERLVDEVAIVGEDFSSQIELMLRHGADPNTADRHQMSLLHKIAANGAKAKGVRRKRCWETISILIRYGANLGVVDSKGETPSGMAKRLGDTQMGTWLSESR